MTTRAKRFRETDEVAAAARRFVRSIADRASTNADDLEYLRELREHTDRELCRAAKAAHDNGWSWTEIAVRLGITRQAARQRFGDNPELSADAAGTSALGDQRGA